MIVILIRPEHASIYELADALQERMRSIGKAEKAHLLILDTTTISTYPPIRFRCKGAKGSEQRNERLFDLSWQKCYHAFASLHAAAEWMLFDSSFSAINHSCKPNVEASWEVGTRRTEQRAMRSLRAGAGLVVAYVNHFQRTSNPQNTLGVICGCSLCRRRGDGLQVSEDNYAQLAACFDV